MTGNRHVRFGGGRLETQVKLCAGRLPYFVVLCADLATLLAVKERAEEWLVEMGLRLKESKTHITHTLDEHEGQTGFDFLGFHVRQYRVGKYRTRTYRGRPGFKTLITPAEKGVKRHTEKVRGIVHQHRGAPQTALITALNPVIRGWTNYYRTCVAKRTFNKMDKLLFGKVMGWAAYRHPNRGYRWRYRRYWRRRGLRMVFSDGKHTLNHYAEAPIVRHVKVRGEKSPYDGDWVYWGARLGRDSTRPGRVIRLLKQQQGRCGSCGLLLTTEDVMEIHHQDGDQRNDRYTNLVLPACGGQAPRPLSRPGARCVIPLTRPYVPRSRMRGNSHVRF